MCFDPVDNLVMATNNADSPPYANIIDVSTNKIVAQIPWPNQSSNGAEQCVYDPRTGLFYETLPEAAGPTGPGDNSQPGGYRRRRSEDRNRPEFQWYARARARERHPRRRDLLHSAHRLRRPAGNGGRADAADSGRLQRRTRERSKQRCLRRLERWLDRRRSNVGHRGIAEPGRPGHGGLQFVH